MNQQYPSQVPGQVPQNQPQTPLPPQAPQNAPQPVDPQGQYQMPTGAPGAPEPGNDQNYGFQPTEMEPQKSGKSSWILIIVLVIVLVCGAVFFADWEGWIKIGFLNSLLGKNTTTTATTTPATKTDTYANDTTRKADLAKIKEALKAYYQANQKYPVAVAVDKTSDPNSVLLILVPTYLASLPKDPVATQYYGYTSDGKTFTLTAVLDNTSDPAGVKSGNYYLYKVTDSSVETPTAATSSSTSGTTGTTGTTSSGTGTTSGTASGSASSNATSQ